MGLRLQSPRATLHRDHEEIRRLLTVLDGMAGAIHDNIKVDEKDAQKAVEIMTAFADQCHCMKEEKALFPALRQSEVQAGGLLEVLTREHEASRLLVSDMRENAEGACKGDGRAAARFEHSATRYSMLQHRHIEIEEQELLPLENLLSATERDAIASAFVKLEKNHDDAKAHLQFHHEIGDLAKRYARFGRRQMAAA